jgi:site-specific DNA recombinase
VYIGEVTHKGDSYQGEQEPLVARALWDEVDAMLDGKRREDHHATRADHPSPLAGRIVDGEDRPMTPRHTTKGTRRYRYYVTAPDSPDGRTPASGWRLPAGEIEQLVQSRLAAWLGSPSEIVAAISAKPCPQALAMGGPGPLELGARYGHVPDRQMQPVHMPADQLRPERLHVEREHLMILDQRNNCRRTPVSDYLCVRRHIARPGTRHRTRLHLARAEGDPDPAEA